MKKKIAITILLIIMITPLMILYFRSQNEEEVVNYSEVIEQETTEGLSDEQRAENMGNFINETYISPNERRYKNNLEDYNKDTAVVDIFINHINDGYFKKAYEMIEEDYKEKNNYSFEDFKNSYNFNNKFKRVAIKSYENYIDHSIIEATISDFKVDGNVGNENNITANPINKTYTVIDEKTLKPTEEEDYILKTNETGLIIGLDKIFSDIDISIEGIEEIRESIKVSLEMLTKVREDFKIKKTDEKTYFNNNKETLIKVFGIKTVQEFTELNKKIDSLSDYNNTNVILENTQSCCSTLYADLVIQDNESQSVKLSFKFTKEVIGDEVKHFIYIK